MGNGQSRTDLYRQYSHAIENPKPISVDSVNPYEVLGVGANFTFEELKAAYRRTARLVHPDKGGSQHLFELVTECFRKLGEEYKLRQGGRLHHELKQEASAYYEDWGRGNGAGVRADDVLDRMTERMGRGGAGRAGGAGGATGVRGGNFNAKFNAFFEQNRMEDEENDKGYGDIMAPSSGSREDISVPKLADLKIRSGKRFNNNQFNQTFEKVVVPSSKDVVVYREPEPLVLAKKIQYTELGSAAPDDFSSGHDGTHGARRGLQYTDYKVATSTTRLVDPRSVAERKEFKSIKEYEAYRARSTRKGLTEEEEAWMNEKKAAEEAAEMARLERLRTRDAMAAAMHAKLAWN